MIKVVVASVNPVKFEAVKTAFNQAFSDDTFEFITVSVNSGVSDQPKSDKETRTGAINRTLAAKKLEPKAQYWVGCEGGLAKINNEIFGIAWMVIRSKERLSIARAASYPLPKIIHSYLDKGYELGQACDIIFNRRNTKHKEGAVGILTNNCITRKEYYIQPLLFALIPFIKKELFEE